MNRSPVIRRLSVLAVALASTVLIAGCARDARPDEAIEGETYTVETPYGDFEVPSDYERVVVTMTALMDSAVAVGVTPVGSPISFAGLPAYMGLEAGAVTSLGESDGEIDIETIGELEPDLILMNVGVDESLDESAFAAYEAIAPTVPIAMGQQDPKGTAVQVAAALDRSDRMTAVAEAYEVRAARLAEALADVPEAQATVSQVRLRPDHVRVMLEGTNAGVAMVDAGLTFAEPLEGADVGDGGFYETSLELLPEALGDTIFVYSTDEGVLENVRTLDIWQQIPAVQSGDEHDVDFEVWMRGQGYLALNEVLDDIARAFGVELS